MRQSLARNLSFTALQLIINQVLSLLAFYFLSTHLSKTDFGEFNWCLAILLTVFSILSFGIDQVLVKKIAAGQEADNCFSLYFFHVIATGLLFYGLLFLGYVFFPFFFKQHYILLTLAIAKLVLFFS